MTRQMVSRGDPSLAALPPHTGPTYLEYVMVMKCQTTASDDIPPERPEKGCLDRFLCECPINTGCNQEAHVSASGKRLSAVWLTLFAYWRNCLRRQPPNHTAIQLNYTPKIILAWRFS
jgi:hypothetical protein